MTIVKAPQPAATQKRRSPKKKKEDENDDVKLEDPTSVTLMNSFLIKNAGSSFENYQAIMKKNRKPKNMEGSNTFGHSATLTSSANPFGHHSLTSPGQMDRTRNTYGKVQEKRPPARDGHSGIIVDGLFLVFGGDRHHMPFNDLYMLDIEQEFRDRNIHS